MKSLWNKFWAWYERTYVLNVSIAAVLFLLQIIHLFWLGGEVAHEHVFGHALFTFEGFWKAVIVLVDYTEIPALFSVSLIYINQLRGGWNWKPVLYLLFLNSQWLHIFWITDEFVETSFNGVGTVLPIWLAYVAIAIDYLEIPVMIDVLKNTYVAIKERRYGDMFKEEDEILAPETISVER